ncbi:MAG: AraC family transcriptional regulator [Clostridia bacterium]|nr:AraC family transcriptional regulator [Clostridia bacterium]
MEQNKSVLAVRRMQTYIEEHISEQITLLQLAKAAGYSPWHCERLFKEYTDKNPFDYIRSLRLSKAALVLRDSKSKVIDVAFDFVFDSHEGFTKAFSRQFGLSPKSYAKGVPPISLFIPYLASDYRRTKLEGANKMQENKNLKPVFVQIVERPSRKVLLRRGIKAPGYFEYCDEVGCEVWGVLSSVKEALYEPIGMWLPLSMRKSGSEYVQGIELPLDYDKPVPEGYELAELPPCKMMVFQGPPFEDDDFEEAIGELWEFVKTFDPKLYGYEWAENEAPRFQLAPMGYRGYIEAKPVRVINA